MAATVAAATSATLRPAAAEVMAVNPEDPTPTSRSRRAAVTLARMLKSRAAVAVTVAAQQRQQYQRDTTAGCLLAAAVPPPAVPAAVAAAVPAAAFYGWCLNILNSHAILKHSIVATCGPAFEISGWQQALLSKQT